MEPSCSLCRMNDQKIWLLKFTIRTQKDLKRPKYSYLFYINGKNVLNVVVKILNF